MGTKKFISTFTIILLCFLVISGFVLITYFNNQEAKAMDASNDPVTSGDPLASPTPTPLINLPTDYIDYPDAFNIMLFVKDVDGYNTDGMMIVNYDPQNKKVSTLSIPRDIVYDTYYAKDSEGNFLLDNGEKVVRTIRISDIYVTEVDKAKRVQLDLLDAKYNAMSEDEKNKLSQSVMDKNYADALAIGVVNGSNSTLEIFENLFSINIKYYTALDLSIFREVIDQLGGVDYYVPTVLDYDDPLQDLHIHFVEGMQHLDGQAAEELLRFRKPNGKIYTSELNEYYPTQGSDIDRINMQHLFFTELIKQKASFFYATKITSVLDVVYDKVDTNIDMPAIISLMKYVSDINMDTILFETMPGEISGNYYIVDETALRQLVLASFRGSNK